MPLSPSEHRDKIHDRSISIQGYRRHDRLWEIEGHLTDVKAYDLTGLYRGPIPAGEAIHRISARLVVDDDLAIHRAEAVIDTAPFPMCGDIAASFATLAGGNLGAGFMRDVRSRFAGVAGCTHICELLGAMATTAFQTIYPLLKDERGDPPGRPALINSCHAFAEDGEVVSRLWPDYAAKA